MAKSFLSKNANLSPYIRTLATSSIPFNTIFWNFFGFYLRFIFNPASRKSFVFSFVTMSKKALKKYLNELSKEQLEEQILELYSRLKEVKQFYDFVFNPNEQKRIEECKQKIYREYFPPAGRKAKKRRSVAHKCIREFVKLGMEPLLIADLMLFNIETALLYSTENNYQNEAFCMSIQKSFIDTKSHLQEHSLISSFIPRLEKIIAEVWTQNWFNKISFQL